MSNVEKYSDYIKTEKEKTRYSTVSGLNEEFDEKRYNELLDKANKHDELSEVLKGFAKVAHTVGASSLRGFLNRYANKHRAIADKHDEEMDNMVKK